MNELKRFNDTLRYIEENLKGELDQEQIARISCCPAGLFGRIFSVLSGMSLGEYIQKRRLSCAAIELAQGRPRILDLALSYGYESEDAFAYAFKRFHGVTPGQARGKTGFQLLPPIHFTLKIEGGSNMDVRIEKRGPFTIAGLSLRGTPGADFGALWAQVYGKYAENELAALGDGQSYGACHDMGGDGQFSYTAGYDCADEQKAEAMGLALVPVPEASYAVATLTGPVPQNIQQGWAYLLGTFLPQQGYRHAGSPDFEHYFEGDMHSADYKMELWVPIEKS